MAKDTIAGRSFLVKGTLTPGKCQLSSFVAGAEPEPSAESVKTVTVDPTQRILIRLHGTPGVDITALNPETQRLTGQLSTHWNWRVLDREPGESIIYATVSSLGRSGDVTATNDAIAIHVTSRRPAFGVLSNILG